MDNRQAIQNQQLAYLAGCIDCDGTIGIHKSGSQYSNWKPTIKVFNTSKKMIDYLDGICKSLYLPHYVYISNPGKSKNMVYKQLYALVAQGFKSTNKWVRIIIPYLYAKRKQAELLKEIIESRLSVPMTGRNQNRLYSQREMEIIEEIHLLNAVNGKGRSRKSSTTKSRTS